MSHYYQDPRPDLISDSLKCITVTKLPSQDEQCGAFIGFYAVIFATNPEKRHTWVKQIQEMPEHDKSVLLLSLKLSEDLTKIKQIRISDSTSTDNDVCWGAFFASGQNLYLSLLVDRLVNLQERKAMWPFLTAASAQWSLSDNAIRHPRVRAYLIEREKSSPQIIKQAIKEALTSEPSLIKQKTINIAKQQHQNGIW